MTAAPGLIGVDFDNTIVCYDGVFHRIAVERGLIPPEVPDGKDAVRNHLRAVGREDDWTELQGLVYGARMDAAAPFPGVADFFRTCRERNLPVAIVSHKTRHPFRGPRHDLHAAAQGWLERQGFLDPGRLGVPADRVFFELTKDAKLARIAALGCRHFIDDLPEFLGEPGFPAGVGRILFDPAGQHGGCQDFRRVASWGELAELLLS